MPKEACYLCNYAAAPHKLRLKDTFTAHQHCQNRKSNAMCDRCYQLFDGQYQFGRYKGKDVFSRNTSWLLANPRDLEDPRNRPHFGQIVGSKGGKVVREILNIPTRVEIRDFLSSPPEPPFEVAVAESGQKHILYQAKTATSRDYFPVVFEETSLLMERETFVEAIKVIEKMLEISTKTEIKTGDWKGGTLFKNVQRIERFEEWAKTRRGTRLLDLVLHVAQSPEGKYRG